MARTYETLSKLTPALDELLEDEIDGQVYTYYVEPRCRVCSSPPGVKEYVDTLIVNNYTYKAILKKIVPLYEEIGYEEDKIPSYQSIRNHQIKHLPFEKRALREIAERRAKDKSKQMLEGTQNLLTAEALYEAIAQKTWERLAEGRLKPTIKDGIEAASALDKLEKEASGELNLSDILAQLNVIIGAVREVVPPNMWNQIQDRIQHAQQQANAIEAVSVEAQGFSEEKKSICDS